jgi:hypothetical protein
LVVCDDIVHFKYGSAISPRVSREFCQQSPTL